ncbi:hypothetical protein [Cryobacterium psychrophilum]|uniref:ABC transporter permease n=1 Tax=Cryobacterium psychrophilum TaxID=41988 RepID=A0A4Y8KML8_9MICO|nr:hypothetical protein [Cryobacterium psychrophilum]TFD76189.1 hypothetical protein E3T53_14220 [Cryobacterium psychrophilum]
MLSSRYRRGFAELLSQPLNFSSFGVNALVQAAYIAVFGALAYSPVRHEGPPVLTGFTAL